MADDPEDVEVPSCRECVQTCRTKIDWNLILSIFLIVVNFIWIIRVQFSFEFGDSSFFYYFQLIFNGLGFLLIRPDELILNQETKFGISFYYLMAFCLYQILLSASLFWAVQTRSIRRMDFWIFQTGIVAHLNALYYLHVLFVREHNADINSSPLFIYICFSVTGYYLFNGFYIWRIHEFRSQLVSVVGTRPNTEKSVCCLCSNASSLGTTAVVYSIYFVVNIIGGFFFGSYIGLLDNVGHRIQENVRVDQIVEFVFCVLGLIAAITVFHANKKDNVKGIMAWIGFHVFYGLAAFTVIAAYIMDPVISDDLNVLNEEDRNFYSMMTSFARIHIPLTITVWIAYVRILEIKFRVVPQTRQNYYVPY